MTSHSEALVEKVSMSLLLFLTLYLLNLQCSSRTMSNVKTMKNALTCRLISASGVPCCPLLWSHACPTEHAHMLYEDVPTLSTKVRNGAAPLLQLECLARQSGAAVVFLEYAGVTKGGNIVCRYSSHYSLKLKVVPWRCLP